MAKKEEIDQHARLLKEAMQEKLPQGVAGVVILFTKDGSYGKIESTIDNRGLVLRILGATQQQLARDASLGLRLM